MAKRKTNLSTVPWFVGQNGDRASHRLTSWSGRVGCCETVCDRDDDGLDHLVDAGHVHGGPTQTAEAVDFDGP